MSTYKYSPDEIRDMRNYCKALAHKLTDSSDLDLNSKDEYYFHIWQLAESILQTYVMAGISFEELRNSQPLEDINT